MLFFNLDFFFPSNLSCVSDTSAILPSSEQPSTHNHPDIDNSTLSKSSVSVGAEPGLVSIVRSLPYDILPGLSKNVKCPRLSPNHQQHSPQHNPDDDDEECSLDISLPKSSALPTESKVVGVVKPCGSHSATQQQQNGKE